MSCHPFLRLRPRFSTIRHVRVPSREHDSVRQNHQPTRRNHRFGEPGRVHEAVNPFFCNARCVTVSCLFRRPGPEPMEFPDDRILVSLGRRGDGDNRRIRRQTRSHFDPVARHAALRAKHRLPGPAGWGRRCEGHSARDLWSGRTARMYRHFRSESMQSASMPSAGPRTSCRCRP